MTTLDRSHQHDDGHDAGTGVTGNAPGKRTLTSTIQRKASGTAPPPAAAAEPSAPIDAAEPFWFADGPRPEGAGPIFRKATAAVRDAGSADAQFAQATGGSGAEIPYRAEMERSFGEDFGGVRAFFGRGAELDDLGALAATRDEHVAFAGASPDRELVAHELTHVVQARRGGGAAVQAKDAVSSPDDAAEHEADAVAARVARGEPAAVRGAAPIASVARKGTCDVTGGVEHLGLVSGQSVFIEDDVSASDLAERAARGGSVRARYRLNGRWTRGPLPARQLAIESYHPIAKDNVDELGGHSQSHFVPHPAALRVEGGNLLVGITLNTRNRWDRAAWDIELRGPSNQRLAFDRDRSWWNNPAWNASEMQDGSHGAYDFIERFDSLDPDGDGQQGTTRTIVAKIPVAAIEEFYGRFGGLFDTSRIIIGMKVQYDANRTPVTADSAEFGQVFGMPGQYHGEGLHRTLADGVVDLRDPGVMKALDIKKGEWATDDEVWSQRLAPNPTPNLVRDFPEDYVGKHPQMGPLVPRPREDKEAPKQALATRIENEATLALTSPEKLADLILMLTYLSEHRGELNKLMQAGGGVLGLFDWSMKPEGKPLVFTDIYLDDPAFTALRSGVGIRKRSTTKATKLNVKTGEGHRVGKLENGDEPGDYREGGEGSDIFRRHEIGFDIDPDTQPEDIGDYLGSGVGPDNRAPDPWNKGGQQANQTSMEHGNGMIDFRALDARMVLQGHRSKFKLSAVDPKTGGTINIELSCDHTVGRTFREFERCRNLPVEEQPDAFLDPTYHHIYNLEMELEHLGAGKPDVEPSTSPPVMVGSSSSMVGTSQPTTSHDDAPVKMAPFDHPGRMYMLDDTHAPEFNTPSYQVFAQAHEHFVKVARTEGLGDDELHGDRQKLESMFDHLRPELQHDVEEHPPIVGDGKDSPPWEQHPGPRKTVTANVPRCRYESVGNWYVITVAKDLIGKIGSQPTSVRRRIINGRPELWFPTRMMAGDLWKTLRT